MFGIDDRDTRRLENALKQLNERAIPFATRETLNNVAFDTQRRSKERVEKKMILRNKWTLQGIRVDMVKTLRISAQQSRTGSIADYMATQENGGRKGPKRGANVVIPTSYAAGQTGNVRTKLPTSRNKLQNIHLQQGIRKFKNRRQQNAVNIKMARGRGVVYLDLGHTRGLFRIDRGGIRLVHDLSRRVVNIPKTEWLGPSTRNATQQMAFFWRRALRFQLNRLGWTG